MFKRFLLTAARRLFRNWSKYTDQTGKADPKSRKLAADLFRVTAIERQKVIEEEIAHETGGIVTAGPFKGMRIDPKTSWGTGDIVPKLLGCYEAELAEALERLKAEPFDAVLNIGSAEGYYAIGSAMIVNAPKVIAMDIDPSAQAATARNAERNGVADKVECRGGIDAEGLAALLTEFPRALIVCDCEGFEVDLITPPVISAGAQSVFLIECHDFIGRPVTEELVALLSASHAVEIIHEGPRDPNAYPMLQGRDSLDRWLAVCEFRPQTMSWIVARPDNSVLQSTD
ncbi:MAG TPA: hypothetical protein DCG48_09765 [Rhodospirillaceae bacterium]|nr:hypothetical protein [Rhodospirillaceae bacterium]|tara:strand:- start:1398 stop:2255 length:858 start_codon:yes stop_codon:yes gene_type:complete